MPPISLSGGNAGPSSAGSSAGVSLPVNLPINLDHSGWNVNIKGSGNQSATGNSDANGIAGGGSALDSLVGGRNLPLVAAAGLVLLLLLRR